MAHSNTVLGQLIKLVPRYVFDQLAEEHHVGQALRKTSRWDQFIAMSLGQLGGRLSLRDIESNLRAQASSLYHLGTSGIPRSSLARLNEQQPAEFFQALFMSLYARCQNHAPGHRFRFKNKLFSLDSSLIDLSLKLFPWAHFAKGKGAVKLHVALDHDGLIPAVAVITESKCHDAHIARDFKLPKASIAVFDRGYTDYHWYNLLNEQGVFFVTRLRRDIVYRPLEHHDADHSAGITSDQIIELTSKRAHAAGLSTLRRIGYRDPDTGRHYVFLTNHFKLSAATIAAVYKSRWDVELFFKWIKQNLKIKAFVGHSKNAILTQIWIALCLYLLIAYLKFSSKITASLQQMLRLLQLNLFLRRNLLELFGIHPPEPPEPDHPPPFQPDLLLA